MLSPMRWKVAGSALACLLAMSAAGCGSSSPQTTTTTVRKAAPLAPVKTCLRKDGYTVTPESAHDLGTAPRRFEFTAVWGLLNPSRVALALTFSRSTDGAQQAAVWTRRENAKISRGAVAAPVVRIGKTDVLWTAQPGAHNAEDVYGCVRREA